MVGNEEGREIVEEEEGRRRRRRKGHGHGEGVRVRIVNLSEISGVFLA